MAHFLTCHGLYMDVQEVLYVCPGFALGKLIHHLLAALAELLQAVTEHGEAGLCLQICLEERSLPLVHAVFKHIACQTGLVVTALSPGPCHKGDQ